MSTAAKLGAFFLVVLILAGVLVWRIEDLRLSRGPAKKISGGSASSWTWIGSDSRLAQGCSRRKSAATARAC